MKKELNNSIVIEFDDKDYGLISNYKWRAYFNKFYWDIRYWRKENGKTKTYLLHRKLLNIADPKARVVFKDGNRLNFRKENLIIEEYRKNRPNYSKNKTSQFIGVEKKSYKNKDGAIVTYWNCRITFNKKTIQLGRFKNEFKAAMAYNKKAIELHGQRAKINKMKNEFDQGEYIIDFLKSHPLISVAGVEKAAGIPEKTLTQAMAGTRKIPEKHWYDLNNLLVDYGYSIDNYVSNAPMYPETVQEIAERICSENTHLLDEPEVKLLIQEWENEREEI